MSLGERCYILIVRDLELGFRSWGPCGNRLLASFYFSVPLFCQKWSNQINQQYRFICSEMDIWILCPQLWLQSSPTRSCDLTHTELALHWAKWVVGWLCTVLTFGICNLLCWDPSLSIVWFQLSLTYLNSCSCYSFTTYSLSLTQPY